MPETVLDRWNRFNTCTRFGFGVFGPKPRYRPSDEGYAKSLTLTHRGRRFFGEPGTAEAIDDWDRCVDRLWGVMERERPDEFEGAPLALRETAGEGGAGRDEVNGVDKLPAEPSPRLAIEEASRGGIVMVVLLARHAAALKMAGSRQNGIIPAATPLPFGSSWWRLDDTFVGLWHGWEMGVGRLRLDCGLWSVAIFETNGVQKQNRMQQERLQCMSFK
ncbi:hypothetical protein FIBSPDRAFT_997566 [Athelia psychrophila]|uniref:Uncharacterized protein n=1 Tax=Athelia psychrophila TaxID=1759441 RepID=A0A165WB76_9AGAM|nr:hypothetical protein FIBSPDRAFT_997566 [Fibularhizoctonia sp. CBS 109695]